MASITRSAHSPKVAPFEGLAGVLRIDSFGELGAGLGCKLARTGKSHIARRTETDFSRFSVPANKKTHRRPPFGEIER